VKRFPASKKQALIDKLLEHSSIDTNFLHFVNTGPNDSVLPETLIDKQNTAVLLTIFVKKT
jgi:hypothetical protein